MLVVVYRRGGGFLLLRRRSARFWQSVSGSLEWDEIPLAAAQRELAEETGLRVASDRLRDEHSRHLFPLPSSVRDRYPRGVTHNLEHVFSYEADCDAEVSLSNEHSAFKWLKTEAALKAAWSWTNRRAIDFISRREARYGETILPPRNSD